MHMPRIFLSIFLLLVVCTSPVLSNSLAPAKDLANPNNHPTDKRLPYVILFTAEHCEYCEMLKENVLHPLVISKELERVALIREVDIESSLAFKGFDGTETSYEKFAQHHGVYVTPTVMVFTPDGKSVGSKLVGYNGSEFYIERLNEIIRQGVSSIK